MKLFQIECIKNCLLMIFERCHQSCIARKGETNILFLSEMDCDGKQVPNIEAHAILKYIMEWDKRQIKNKIEC